MGRTAYEGISGPMTTATDHPFAPILNAARKVVFSRTLETAEWANTTIAAGDTVEEIDKLRLGGDGHIVVWGGVSFWRSLMRLDLLDELRRVGVNRDFAPGRDEEIEETILRLD
jgi:dihydrofolate reductase